MIRAALAFLLLASPASAQGIPFTIEQRPNVNWASVPVVRADRQHTITALDVVPNGRPEPYGIFGRAWLHVCSRDLKPAVPMHCGMIAAADGVTRIGITNHHGARPGRVEFVVGNKVVGRLDARKIEVGDFDSAAVLAELRALRAEVKTLRHRVYELERQTK